MELWKERCHPAKKGQHPLTSLETAQLLPSVPGWMLEEGDLRLVRESLFPDFKAAIRFVTDVSQVAEEAGHHPDIHVHYDRVRLVLWTHSIGGLSRNDFIVASRINALCGRTLPVRRRTGS